MKVMTLEPDPAYGGGSEAMALAISRELAARGHHIFLLHEVQGSMLPAYCEFVSGVFQRKLPGFSLRAPVETIACAIRIGRLARKQGIDAIFSAHLGYLRIGALVRRLYGIPFCFHLGLPALDLPRFSQWAFRWLDAGIAPSEHTLGSWDRAGWSVGKIVAVPNWVDTERFRPRDDRHALRKELGVPNHSRCIVYVGRLGHGKGIETLIRAFAHVRAKVDDASLIIVGKFEPGYEVQLSRLMNELEEKDQQAVILRPVSSAPEKYFACADVACVPSSHEESFGLTLLEAMACELPVVATTVGLFPQILGEDRGDLLVAPGDHTGLAERLAWWLTHSDAAIECGQGLRRRVKDHFGSGKSIEVYERILLGLAIPERGRSHSLI
jgi:mannosyltransferase